MGKMALQRAMRREEQREAFHRTEGFAAGCLAAR